MAALAAQGLTGDGQSTADLAQIAATGPAPGATTSTDPTTAAVLAAGAAPQIEAVPLTADAPGGTMAAPAPVSNAISFTASKDFQTVTTGSGNATGTVSGNQNTILATGGIATVNITGSGNTVSTGAYDDTISVSSSGNTINASGGRDTIILAYPEPQSGAASPAPLATAGNIFITPPAGAGPLTIVGTLAKADRIDVTKSLVGLAGYNGKNAWRYLSISSSTAGLTLSVKGTPVVILADGVPSQKLKSFVTASAP